MPCQLFPASLSVMMVGLNFPHSYTKACVTYFNPIPTTVTEKQVTVGKAYDLDAHGIMFVST